MSENVRFYQQKIEAGRSGGRLSRPLSSQLLAIFATVADCERRWALDDRMERRLGRA